MPRKYPTREKRSFFPSYHSSSLFSGNHGCYKNQLCACFPFFCREGFARSMRSLASHRPRLSLQLLFVSLIEDFNIQGKREASSLLPFKGKEKLLPFSSYKIVDKGHYKPIGILSSMINHFFVKNIIEL